jgi:hypothetical protein
MTAYENSILAFLAFVCLAVAILVVLKYYKQISLFVLIIVAGGAVLFGGLVVLAAVGSAVYEEYTAKQCLTAHERRARAMAAPDDYFGRQLREQAMEEAKWCAEIAAKREAAKQK